MQRCDVYWCVLDPTVGTEIKKTRPALIVSNDDMNDDQPRVIIAPITSKGQPAAYRPEVSFQKRKARILLDQIRSIDKSRLTKKLGTIDEQKWHPILLEMFE
jgi:mRNA interferase MazF